MPSYKILSRFYSFQNISADRNARCTLRLVSTVTLVVRMYSSHILRLEPFIISVLMSELAYDMFKGHIKIGMFYSLLYWECGIFEL